MTRQKKNPSRESVMRTLSSGNEVADKAVNELERIQVYLVVAADGHLLEFLQLDINLVIDLALDV